MAMSKRLRQLYKFGPFSIDAAERELIKDEQVVQLTPKAFDLLMVLVENSGHVVEKEELMRELWPDTFVEEANLTNNVSLLRKALGGDKEHQYIETVARRGYRFVADVTESAEGLTEVVVEERSRATFTLEEVSSPEHAVAVNERGERRKRLVWPRLVAAFVLLGLAYGVYQFWPKRSAPQQPIRSMAVLPFKPLIADSRNESLEMGMSETLITRLSSMKELVVRPMNAVRKYAGLEQDPVAAGKEQRVDAVLDGHVQKTAERIRVTVRLVRISDNHTLWADKFDASLADIFALQDSISERVLVAIAVKLTGEERQLLTRHHTDSPEAYQLYLKGRLFNSQWTEEGIQKALESFDRAIAIDPNYALAYAGKADVYSANSSVFLLPAEAMPKAREAALRALEIDDRLAEAHRSMALVKLFADWDFVGAEQEFKRALDIKPNDADTHHSYSGLLVSQKRFDEALAESRRARELDPLSLRIGYMAGRYLYFARQYEQALEECREFITLHPNSADLHRALGCVFREKRIHEEAIRELRRAVDLRRLDSYVSDLGHTYGLAGRRDEAKKLVKELEDLSRRRYVSPLSIARIYAGLGEKDLVFRWLDKGYEDRSDHLLMLGVDPSFDGLRSDPRFAGLLRSIGLEE